MMFTYDQNKGEYAFIGHLVEICHTSSDMDGLRGRIGGWGDPNQLIALVILDAPYETFICRCDTERFEVVSMPVVCLKRVTQTA